MSNDVPFLYRGNAYRKCRKAPCFSYGDIRHNPYRHVQDVKTLKQTNESVADGNSLPALGANMLCPGTG